MVAPASKYKGRRTKPVLFLRPSSLVLRPYFERIGPEGDDGEVARRVAAEVGDDAGRRQGVDRRLDLVDGPHQSEANVPARADVDSSCMMSDDFRPACTRATSSASMPSCRRFSSARVTSSVSWARSLVVPA